MKTTNIVKLVCLFLILLIILFVGVTWILYCHNIIGTQAVETTNIGVHAAVGFRKGDDPFHYMIGFFITKNKVVIDKINYTGDWDFRILDMKENVYNVINVRSYKNFSVLTTDRNNIISEKYIYGRTKKDDTVYAFLRDSKIINYLSNCKVINTNCVHDGIKYSLCKGKIKGHQGGAAIDKNGRILGRVVAPAGDEDMFFIYPYYEILKDIIIGDIKTFLKID